MEDLKLNVVLAKTDTLGTAYKNSIKDYVQFFNKNQGAFLGEKRTYTPAPDTVDEPNKRGIVKITTTVKEKLDWFEKSNAGYLDMLFTQEKTNASGVAKAELIVDGNNWGEFTSLELLRLKSLLESGELKQMYSTIPVRSDAAEWSETKEEMYQNRIGVFESPLLEFENKTTVKENYILEDPNVKSGKITNYTPQVAVKNITAVLGKGSQQKFSGEWSQRQRAELLTRLQNLYIGVIEALKKANEVSVVESNLSAKKIFDYLHNGK